MLGGTGSLTPELERQVRTYAPQVERIAGADRYAVSRSIAAEYFSEATTIFIATGNGFPDALAGAGAAAALGAPVVLIDGLQTPLAPQTDALLRSMSPDAIVILGGPGTIVPGLEAALRDIAPSVTRMGGADRFAVSVAISEAFVPTATTALMTTGMNFPDALTGAALAAAGLPLYLVPTECPTTAVLDDALVRLAVEEIVILGGVGSVSANTERLYGCSTPTTDRTLSEVLLREKIVEMAGRHDGVYSVSVRELGGLQASVSVGGGSMQEPVSVIKLFAAYGILDRIDSGRFTFDTVTRSGETVHDCLRAMIHVSDNYCHWDLVALIGEQTLNNQFWAEGYRQTVYAGYRGDGAYFASKLSTTDDLALLLSRLQRGLLLSPSLTEHFMTLLETQLWRSKLPSGVAVGVPVANKTGSAWSSSGWFHSDAGIIAAPGGTYVISVLGSRGATSLGVREIGRTVYEHFNGPLASAATWSDLNSVTIGDITYYRYGSESTPLGVIPAGTRIETYGSARTFYQVIYDGAAVYVHSSGLRNYFDYPRSAR